MNIYRVKNELVKSDLPAIVSFDDKVWNFLSHFQAPGHEGLEIYIGDEERIDEVVEELREGEDFALELTGWLEFLRQEIREHGECWLIID